MGTASDVRLRILRSAARVFRDAGFQTASMARVARAAGVSKGLPYHYFESKESLAAAVVAEHLEEVLAVLSGWPPGPPAGRLRWFLRTALDDARARADSYRLFLSLALQPATRRLVMDEVAARRRELGRLDVTLRSLLVDLGHPTPDTEALILRAAVDGLIQYLILEPDRFPTDEAVERLMELHGSPLSGGR